MTTSRTLFIGLALVGSAIACATTGPSFLNPNPTTGGECGNGDQLSTLCGTKPTTWCCADNYSCGTAVGECYEDPLGPMYGAKRRDAGAAKLGLHLHCTLPDGGRGLQGSGAANEPCLPQMGARFHHMLCDGGVADGVEPYPGMANYVADASCGDAMLDIRWPVDASSGR